MAHLNRNRKMLKGRVRRIAGQISALERAIEREEECATILHQVAGIRGAVGGLMDALLEDHLREHVAGPGLSNKERQAGAADIAALLRRYGKK